MDDLNQDGARAVNGGDSETRRSRTPTRSTSRPKQPGPNSRTPTPKKESRSSSQASDSKPSHDESHPLSRNGGSPVNKKSPSPSNSPPKVKSRSGSVSSAHDARPKMTRQPSQMGTKRKIPVYSDLPDSTEEACSTFQVIPDCLYGSKHMGSTDTDALDCDCPEEWRTTLPPFPCCDLTDILALQTMA